MNACTPRNLSWILAVAVVSSALAACASLPRPPQDEQTHHADAGPNYVGTAPSSAEVEQMLAPIALYPDAVLILVLAASTSPDDVTAAAQWSRTHSDLLGNDAYRAARGQGWDPAVTSLAAFPGVLQMMSEQIDWTRRLGDAFLAQSGSVSSAIRDLRRRAMAAGALEGAADDIFVFDRTRDIVIGHGFHGYYYIPSCNPFLAYGSWPWPDYPPANAALWVYQYDWAACDWYSHIHVRVDRRVLNNRQLMSKQIDRDRHHPYPLRQSATWTPGGPANRHPSTQFWIADSNTLRSVAPPTLLSRTAAAPLPFAASTSAQASFTHDGSISGRAHMGSVFHMGGSLSAPSIRTVGGSVSSSSSSAASGRASISTSSGGSASSSSTSTSRSH